jgi:aspartyl-tRNA(Asn)/glutamyl-tRNA(Gln) amidotransferase subunit A
MHYASITALHSALSKGETTCVDLTQAYLKRIEEKKHLNIFIETFDESALEQAKRVDQKLKEGNAGRLAGVVIALKDNICYRGHKVSASSKILNGFESLYSATVTEKLLAEDAIIIGRVSCDEFAMGSSNEHSVYGPVRNPLDENRVPGGSSGGSAAALAAQLCHASLGSDTGGSIRQPASFCGLYGFKPSYGRVSRWGLIAYASSLDQIGPFTQTLEDSALITEIISGKDEYDSTLSSKAVEDYGNIEANPYINKIAVLREAVESEGLHPDVKANINAWIEKLRDQNHQVDIIDFPLLDKLVPTYYVIANAEASSNLSRFDGIRFGHRSEETSGIESTYVKSRTEGFGKEVKRRIMMGTFVLSAGYYDAYYTKAMQVRQLLADKTQAIFADYDFILTPTTPHPAFEIGKNSSDPVAMYLEDIFTVHANLVGTPAISLPFGKSKEGLPFGIQLMANRFEEKKLFDFAAHMVLINE